MKTLDHTFETPEENLACDEALLDLAEEAGGPETLRFWESSSHVVVLGSSNRAAVEANLGACERDRVPVLRRRSGGGAVLQGPGCLSYCLILRIEGAFSTISATNSFVLGRHAEVLSGLIGRQVRHEGLTDLAVDGLKISGNSQRRRLQYLMFHGTFLLNLDVGIIGRYLSSPSKQPEYRKDRSHEEFLLNTGLTSSALKESLRRTWSAGDVIAEHPRSRINELVRTRYGLNEWNLKL
jgi:lipoate-protein ligase A